MPAPPPAIVLAETIEPKNVIYTPPLDGPARVRLIPLPALEGALAIWGATGRDHRGTVYLGVSCESIPRASAHLLSLNPANDGITVLGNVRQQCQRLSIECGAQNKIHTKILQAADGRMYFASMDETGEAEDGSVLPVHGSHLWRMPAGGGDWEHLGHVPEGVIAAAVGGPFVYYLGYHGHVLHQYHTGSGTIKTIRVGSVGGHTTRNFFADRNGRVFVPRVTAQAAELVEFDEGLVERAVHPLADYSLSPDENSHGLVGVATLKNGDTLFTTDRGRLYRRSGDVLVSVHKFDGYSSCLFSPDGERHVCALVEKNQARTWQRLDLTTNEVKSDPLILPLPPGARNVLTYGSTTRDDAGRCYIVGRYMIGDRSVPALWVIE